MNPKSLSKIDYLLFSLFLALSLLITLGVGLKSYDTAYITFRYAENLASGEGFSFNSGEPHLGTATPLFTLILAGLRLAFTGTSIPTSAQWLTGAALFFLALFTYLLGRESGRPLAGLAGSLLVFFNPILVTLWGGEWIFFLALVVAGVFFCFKENELLTGVLIGLACLTRGEGILLGGLIVGYYVFFTKRIPWKLALTTAVLVVPWTIYALLTFGSPVPSSLIVGMAQMDSGLWDPFLQSSMVMAQELIASPYEPGIDVRWGYLVLFVVALIGGLSVALRPREGKRWLLLLLWVGGYTIGYALLDISFYSWYFSPLLLGAMVLFGVGTGYLIDFAIQRLSDKPKPVLRITLLVLSGILVLPVIAGLNDVLDFVSAPIGPVQELYKRTGEWLAEKAPEGTSVGFFEIGFMGYYSKHPFVDPAGLINPGVKERIARGDFKWAYRHYCPDLIVMNPVRWYERLGSIRDEPWFRRAYREVGAIEQEGYYDAPLVIYRLVDAKQVPRPGSWSE